MKSQYSRFKKIDRLSIFDYLMIWKWNPIVSSCNIYFEIIQIFKYSSLSNFLLIKYWDFISASKFRLSHFS